MDRRLERVLEVEVGEVGRGRRWGAGGLGGQGNHVHVEGNQVRGVQVHCGELDLEQVGDAHDVRVAGRGLDWGVEAGGGGGGRRGQGLSLQVTQVLQGLSLQAVFVVDVKVDLLLDVVHGEGLVRVLVETG